MSLYHWWYWMQTAVKALPCVFVFFDDTVFSGLDPTMWFMVISLSSADLDCSVTMMEWSCFRGWRLLLLLHLQKCLHFMLQGRKKSQVTASITNSSTCFGTYFYLWVTTCPVVCVCLCVWVGKQSSMLTEAVAEESAWMHELLVPL